MNRNTIRMIKLLVACLIMSRLLESTTFAGPFGGVQNSFTQLQLQSPGVGIQGYTSLSYANNGYTVPGSTPGTTGVVTTNAFLTNTVQPSIEQIQGAINVSVGGSPYASANVGFGVDDNSTSTLNPFDNRPPTNVDYLYYLIPEFHVTGYVAPGDSLSFTYGAGTNGSVDNFFNYTKTFGPGNFDVSGGGTFYLGDYYDLGFNDFTNIGMYLQVNILRDPISIQNTTYINMDPSLSVSVPNVVPEPAAGWMTVIGFMIIWGLSKLAGGSPFTMGRIPECPECREVS